MPVPILASASVPPVLTIGPVRLSPVALLLPMVKVGAPVTASTVPAPDRPLIVSLKPLSFSDPESTKLPAVAPSGIWLFAPRARTPLVPAMLVAPW